MPEYIERESLLIDVDSIISMMHVQARGEPIQESAIKLVEKTRDYIASFPAADVAEVVRCKDCVWRGREECAMFYRCDCGEQHTRETDNDYCSYGARMDKEAGHESD